ncbi:hypothetical protein RFI_07831 [Reticulomyxa filosa]|uniref:PPM-type phosphatase domain-containing protein n=1 Tax=Reticulomyxa filosa TaxID=46433 RepID=X6NVH7_RETFI|nr:hypothetical protein RFI_07831 [Reticulomyxa filosa]|eukprot:ETO29292.1 hypothetical protein RFI_07831 [Reticulomyxa filosa]
MLITVSTNVFSYKGVKANDEIPNLTKHKGPNLLWENLSKSAQRHIINRGRVAGYTLNWYQANNPIEDTHAVRPILHTHPLKGMLFGIFDGHSGKFTSEFCKNELFDFIEYVATKEDLLNRFDPFNDKKEEFTFITARTEQTLLSLPRDTLKYSIFPFTEAFQLADAVWLKSNLITQHSKEESGNPALNGSCAVVCHVKEDLVTTAWVGDCRAVVGRKVPQYGLDGVPSHRWECVPLTNDHQIDINEKEKNRLLGEHPGEDDVIRRNRVKGRLQPTRVFGDAHYKDTEYFKRWSGSKYYNVWTPPYVTAKPDISYYQIQDEDKFMIIATDGLFQDLNNVDVFFHSQYILRLQLKKKKINIKTALFACLDTQWIANPSTHLIKHALLAACEQAMPLSSLVPEEKRLSAIMNLPIESKRRVHDDVTVIVIFFDNEGNTETDLSNLGRSPHVPHRYVDLLEKAAKKKSML